jgi:hypothetical protein
VFWEEQGKGQQRKHQLTQDHPGKSTTNNNLEPEAKLSPAETCLCHRCGQMAFGSKRVICNSFSDNEAAALIVASLLFLDPAAF